MSPFEFLSGGLSIVLGLAVTLLLTSFLNAFRARRGTRMNWVPLTWATYVLIMQFDVWWEVYGLSSLESWSVGTFVALLVLALSLFAAGGLVLPSRADDYPSDLGEYFDQDGRWGVAMVSVFMVVASVANVVLFDIEPFGGMNLFNVAGLAFAAMAFLSSRPKIRGAATVLFGVYLAAYLWAFLPRTYGSGSF
jgi:hypothetical protein